MYAKTQTFIQLILFLKFQLLIKQKQRVSDDFNIKLNCFRSQTMTKIIYYFYQNRMTEKFSYEEWRRECANLVKTKQSIEQMSKLYIISHEKVKKIIRRCQTDLQYDPISDCEKQLQFIKIILERLAQRQNDEYLSKIDPKVLDKYERNFYELIQLMRLALATNDSKEKIDIPSLQGISENKHTKKGQFSLRSQLKKSENRMVRTKSGHRITKDTLTSTKKAEDESDFQQLNTKGNMIQIVDPQKHQQQFIERKTRLEQMINSHIDKKGYTLDFRKKYEKLDDYLQERKQFSDLLFSQKYFDQMIQMSKTRKNQAKIQEKKDPDLNKIFPQFNIKTKYMKKQVKQNILQVIFDVKKELLKQYHQANVTKMRQTNEGGMLKLNFKNKEKKSNRSQVSETSSNQRMQTRFRSTNRVFEKRRHSLVNLRGTFRNTESEWRKDDQLKKQEQKAFEMFSQSKMPHYRKV